MHGHMKMATYSFCPLSPVQVYFRVMDAYIHINVMVKSQGALILSLWIKGRAIVQVSAPFL